MTEANCLQYCKERGFDWNGLYDRFRRVSCWLCPLQSLSELRKLWEFYPDLWEKLRRYDEMTWRKYRADYSVKELEMRFAFENECLKPDDVSQYFLCKHNNSPLGMKIASAEFLLQRLICFILFSYFTVYHICKLLSSVTNYHELSTFHKSQSLTVQAVT